MKNPKCIILVGPPGGGKTTWAKQFMLRNRYDNYVRVSRDDCRDMLKGSTQCEPAIEKMITEITTSMIITALSKRQNVIVDNTHLKASHLNELVDAVEEYGDIEYMLFNLPLKKCLENNRSRERQVEETLLKEKYKDFENLVDTYLFQNKQKVYRPFMPKPFTNNTLPEAIIVDLDGTLCRMVDRDPYDLEKVDDDLLVEHVAEQIEFHRQKGRYIILLSGREDRCLDLTKEWLDVYGVGYDELIMRKTSDPRKDEIIKREIFHELRENYNVFCVYDDRLSVVKMWHEEGVFCFNVNQGLRQF